MASVLNTASSIRLSRPNTIRSQSQQAMAPLSVSFARRRLMVRAAETDTNEVQSQAPDKAPAKNGSNFNQLLGIKGAALET
ncbi:hypothetical protein CRG98_045093, partial [Punica granatum]